MTRQRSPGRDKAYELYKKHNGDITNKKIAETLKIPSVTVRGWKNKDHWEDQLNGTFQLEVKKVTERSKMVGNKRTQNKKIGREEVKHILENKALTDKQKLFCSYYVKYRNKTKAYMFAYGVNYASANSHAYELWSNVVIKDEINKQLKELRDNISIDAQDIIQKYIDIAFADVKDYLVYGQKEVPVMTMYGPLKDEETKEPVMKIVNYVDFIESSKIDGTIISEVKMGKDGATIKLQSKEDALKWLGNHVELLDTATKQKLDLEKEKIAITREKLEVEKNKDNKGGNDQADGNLKAMLDALK